MCIHWRRNKQHKIYSEYGDVTTYEEVTEEEWDRLGERSRSILTDSEHGAILVKKIREGGENNG